MLGHFFKQKYAKHGNRLPQKCYGIYVLGGVQDSDGCGPEQLEVCFEQGVELDDLEKFLPP